MKKLACCWLLLAFSLCAYPQQHAMRIKTPPISFDSAARIVLADMSIFDPSDTSEGGDVNAFRRWTEFFSNRVSHDAPTDSNMLEPANKGLEYYLNNQFLYCSSNPGSYDGNWKCVGPFTNYYGVFERQGRIDALWGDPNDIGHILAGANMGGLWETHDTGHTWHNISDPTINNGSIIPGTMGITRIAVNPISSDTLYTVLNMDKTSGKHGGYAMGLAYSEDQGHTWQQDVDFLNANTQTAVEFPYRYVRDLAYMPNSTDIFAISNNRIFHKTSQSSNWQNITPDSNINLVYTAIDFSVQNPGKAVFGTTALNNISHLWIYDVSNQTWDSVQVLLPTPDTQLDQDGVVDISISSNDIAFVILKARRNGTGDFFLITTPISSGNTQVVSNSFRSPNWPNGVFDQIKVSPSNPNVIYLLNHDGLNSFHKSINGGVTITDMQGGTHADAREIYLYSTNINDTNDIVLGGSDGGVVMKREGEVVFSSITGDSLAITQFYGMSNTEADEDIMTGGAQDNGGFSYIKDRPSPWVHEVGGDNFLTEFANNGVTTAYIQGNPEQWEDLYSIAFNTSLLTATPNNINNPVDYANPGCPICVQNNVQKPMYFDSDTNAFAGYQFIWTKPFSSNTWTQALTFDPKTGGRVCDFLMSEPVHDTMYVAYRDESGPNPLDSTIDMRLFRSTEATNIPISWVNITPPLVQYARINDIETDMRDMRRLWIAFGNVAFWRSSSPPDSMTSRVFYSQNFGDNYIDISKGLPCLPVNKILYDQNNNTLYAATDVGVFTCCLDSFDAADTVLVYGSYVNWSVEWKCFNNGLPPVVVTDMEFNHCAAKLRIATFGRGIWETPLYESYFTSPPGNTVHLTADDT